MSDTTYTPGHVCLTCWFDPATVDPKIGELPAKWVDGMSFETVTQTERAGELHMQHDGAHYPNWVDGD